MAKYHNQKVVIDGVEFDSKREAQRYQQLKLLEKARVITNLQRQVRYELIPSQYIDGKCVERPVYYYSDFEYDELVPLQKKTIMADAGDRVVGNHIVEDVKGVRTKEYILKRKLMLYKYGIRIREF